MVKPTPDPFYSTKLGSAFLGDSLHLMSALPERSVNLVITSPPYALHFKKEYGNANQDAYIAWFLPFAEQVNRILVDDGSFVIDIGGAWTPGHPTRSLYHFELLLRLCRDLRFYLAQEFYWYNPAKLPSPAEWVTVRKIRVKDAVECIWWLSKTPHPKANNRNVLTEYSPDMLRIIRKGYKAKVRPSGHIITNKFKDRGGAIPPNILIFGNNDATGSYMAQCKEAGRIPHPARFPIQLPTFFIRFLTEPGDLVLDPFAGSNTTGEAAEREERRWLAYELERRYLEDSRFRFALPASQPIDLSRRHGELNSSSQEPSLFGPA
ncbi:MAG: site-specific DNA-methyltransferase [Planctomycetota bacterium]|nr:site-specific DNA-methyltransferase [Planctomycetota bacterium]